MKSVQAIKGQNVPKNVITEKKKTSLTHLLCLSNPENSKNNPEHLIDSEDSEDSKDFDSDEKFEEKFEAQHNEIIADKQVKE